MSRQRQSLAQRVLQAALVVLLLPVILPSAVLVLALAAFHRAALYLFVWLVWLPKGKNVLLVYSESPIWHDYMLREILPLVSERAVVLNWSERNSWEKWSLTAHIFRTFGGSREFNPMVVVFKPLRTAKIFRFWTAFKDAKRGWTSSLDQLRNEVEGTLK